MGRRTPRTISPGVWIIRRAFALCQAVTLRRRRPSRAARPVDRAWKREIPFRHDGQGGRGAKRATPAWQRWLLWRLPAGPASRYGVVLGDGVVVVAGEIVIVPTGEVDGLADGLAGT